MKHSLVALLLLVAAILHLPAQEGKEAITKDMALKWIAIFRVEPDSERGHLAASIIVRFAKESPDVDITSSPTLLPWMAVKPLPKQSSTLLAAYIAGSARSQIESGMKKNDAVAGEEQVIETYQKLQQTNPDLRIDAVEKLIDLQKQGKLKEYLESP